MAAGQNLSASRVVTRDATVTISTAPTVTSEKMWAELGGLSDHEFKTVVEDEDGLPQEDM